MTQTPPTDECRRAFDEWIEGRDDDYIAGDWDVWQAAWSSRVPSPSEQAGWRTMDSAPRDGINILACSAGTVPKVTFFREGKWRPESQRDSKSDALYYLHFTCWKPLDLPPQTECAE